MRLVSGLVVLASLVPSILALKEGDFKQCSQSAFCRRGRALSQRATDSESAWKSPYSVDPATIVYSPTKSSFTARVLSELYPDIKFELQVRIHEDGVARVRMDEIEGLRKRYDEAASWALIAEPQLKAGGDITWTNTGATALKGAYDDIEIIIAYSPLQITLRKAGRDEIVINGRGLFHMEHFRNKTPKVEAVEATEGEESSPEEQEQKVFDAGAVVSNTAWFEGEEEDGYWEESFLSWTDSKPKGPQSLSLDIDFPGHSHVYGIPQHAAPLALPTTTGPDAFFSDPYRLYNNDVFEYLASSPMSLYGSIPLLHAHSAHSTVGVFNAVASETWIDIFHPKPESTATHWISESGILDVFLLPGPTPDAIFSQYARLTGAPALPAHWALGYHQCRWNYISSEDVRSVARRFDEDDMPLDVIWLDIEYAPDHKYFIWNDQTFPDPVEMTNDVAGVARKMVVIIDPHLKRTPDYPVFKEAEDLSVLVKKPDGSDYEGWCWSGSSAWVDFFHPGSWDWWKGVFKLTDDPNSSSWRWKESTENIHIWNDMNEPSIFNGPEITMPKDMVHYGGWEHRDVHNINGMLFQNLTSQALVHRSDVAKRPFVLSRSFYAGSQRFGAIWTGDNMGTWEHMAVGISMSLANGIAGMTFSGADVGGFFGNPATDMLVRWYQGGAFLPFFRAHAHIDTKRREPYLLDEPYKSMVRDILRLRYTLLPIWYTAFREASVTGIPVIRPHYVVFPKDPKGFSIDDQYFVGGSGLLVKPVVKPDVTEIDIYLPENQIYYDYFDHKVFRGSASGKNVTVSAPLEKTPLLIRGGSILPIRPRPRRSSPLMKKDPFTFVIALDNTGSSARGELYLDDGETYSHQKGEVVWREFTASKNGKGPLIVRSTDLVKAAGGKDVVDGVALDSYNPANAFAKQVSQVRVERLIILGLASEPKSIRVVGGGDLEWTFVNGQAAGGSKEGGKASELIVKSPGVHIVDDWAIEITL